MVDATFSQTYDEAQRVIAALTELEDYDEAAVVEVMTGVRVGTFIELDARPGQWGDYSAWHWKLRRCRNSGGLFDPPVLVR